MTARTLPVVAVKRRYPNSQAPGYELAVIDCPYCGKEHTHGGRAGDVGGHRVSHCGPKHWDNPGYVIDDREH